MINLSKKGISPVIATVLLISLGLILAVIIFMWAQSFVSEQTQKFGETIENSCSSNELIFDAEIYIDENDLYLNIVNRGNIPIYGLEIRKVGAGSILNIATSGRTIPSGDTAEGLIIGNKNTIGPGDLLFVPMLLGEKDDQKVSYTCEDQFGLQVRIPGS